MDKTLTLDDINRAIVKADYIRYNDTTLMLCILTLVGGFLVVGQSPCIDPAIFDEAVGRTLARNDAVSKVWTLEGYLLNFKLRKGLDAVCDERDAALAQAATLTQSLQEVAAENDRLRLELHQADRALTQNATPNPAPPEPPVAPVPPPPPESESPVETPPEPGPMTFSDVLAASTQPVSQEASV
jgi:hypothetical protein